MLRVAEVVVLAEVAAVLAAIVNLLARACSLILTTQLLLVLVVLLAQVAYKVGMVLILYFQLSLLLEAVEVLRGTLVAEETDEMVVLVVVLVSMQE